MIQKVHIHRYEKTEWGRRKTVVWKCTLDECTHYLHPEMIKGRLCLCYKCGHSFKLDKNKLERRRPICDVCLGIAEDRPVVKAEKPVEKPIEVKIKPARAIPSLANIDIRELLKDL
jgi:hypothetical protein